MSSTNDTNTALEDLKQKIRVFCDERDWDQFHDPKELAIGLITEASELLEIFRFQSQEQVQDILKRPQTRTHVEDELADAFFFILRFAGRNAIDLTSALERKMEKNAKRYPVELARGSNSKYNQFGE